MIAMTSSIRKGAFCEGGGVSLYISCIFLLAFLDAVFDNTYISILLLLLLSPGVFLFIWQVLKSIDRFILLIAIFMVLTTYSIIHHALYIKFMYFIMFSLWLSCYLRVMKISRGPIAILLYALTLYVIYFSLFQGLSVNRMFSSGSRNLLSYFALFIFSFYCLLSYINHKKIQMIPILCVLIICLLAIGRTGIVLSAVLFFAWSISLINVKLSIKKISFIIFVIVSALFIFSEEVAYIFEQFYMRLDRLERYGFANDHRNNMLDHYLSKLDLINVFLGFNYTEDRYFMKWDFNPHNSYIRLHLYTGIFGVISFLSLYLFSSYYWFKKSIFMLVVLNVIVIRIYIDTLAFFGILDFVLFAIILNPLPSWRRDSFFQRNTFS